MSRMAHAPRRARFARGQALVETLAALPWVVAMFSAVVLLARLHDLESRTISTARYAAFLRADAPASRSAAVLNDLALARTWAPDVGVAAVGGRWSAQPFAAGFSPNWRAPTTQARLIETAESVTVTVANGSLTGAPGRTLDVALAATRAVGVLAQRRFDLRNENLLSATATTRLNRVDAFAGALSDGALQLTDRVSLLADPWSVSGPRHTESRVQSLMPSSGVGRLLDLVTPLQYLISVFEPEFRNLCVGHVDPEVLPPDRLAGSTSLPRTSWRPACRP